MKKSLIVFLLAIPMIVNAAALSVFDSLFSKGMKGLDSTLAKHSLDGVSATKIKSSIIASLEALSKVDGQQIELKQLKEILDRSPSSDAEIFKLKKLLGKNVDDLNATEIGDLVNGLSYIALSKGANKSKLLTCSLCAGDDLSSIGIKALVRTPGVGTTASKLSKTIPTSNSSLNRILKSKFTKLKLGDFVEQSVGKITPDEKRSLAFFLGYLEKGTPEEKKLAMAIVSFSKDESGNPRLLENNKLWSIFDSIPEKSVGKEKRENFIQNLSAMLEEISDEKPIDGGRNTNFRNYLERRAKEEPSLQKYLDEFNSRSLPCWGL